MRPFRDNRDQFLLPCLHLNAIGRPFLFADFFLKELDVRLTLTCAAGNSL